MAAGRRAKGTIRGTFTFADGTDADFTNAVQDRFACRFAGGYYFEGGNFGVGTVPAAKMHIDQPTSDAAIPVLALGQADLSEGFVDYLGTSAASAVGPISSWTTGNTIQGFVRVEINGAAYWMPYYDAPTS